MIAASARIERRCRAPGLFLCALSLLVVSAGPLRGQRAPVFLEPGHWAWEAIRRLNVLGVAPASSDPALAPVTRQHAIDVFEAAAETAQMRGRADLVRLAEGYGELLREHADTAGVLAALELSAGWSAATGSALAGDGYFVDEDWEGAQPLGDLSGPAARVRGHGFLRPWLSWQADVGVTGGEWTVPSASAGLSLGPFDAWAGRRRLHYGIGHGGGIVLGTGLGGVPALAGRTYDTFDGIGIHVRDPFHFPSVLRILGPDRIEVVAGRLDANGRVDAPWIVFGRLIGTPFTRRFTLGINRGAIFGGGGNPITAGRLAGLILGLHGGEGGEFENQVFSVLGRLRPPLGPLPVELYAEFGMDDTAGAISDMPGIIAGVDIGAVPGIAPLSLGLEHTQYPGSCCGNPIWYRNGFFRGAWADQGKLFAHPLGGHGREWLAHARIDFPATGLLVRMEAFTRSRGHENLFAPERTGRSRGVAVGIDYRPSSALQFRLDAGLELADEWDAQRVDITVAHDFGADIR